MRALFDFVCHGANLLLIFKNPQRSRFIFREMAENVAVASQFVRGSRFRDLTANSRFPTAPAQKEIQRILFIVDLPKEANSIESQPFPSSPRTISNCPVACPFSELTKV